MKKIQFGVNPGLDIRPTKVGTHHKCHCVSELRRVIQERNASFRHRHAVQGSVQGCTLGQNSAFWGRFPGQPRLRFVFFFAPLSAAQDGFSVPFDPESLFACSTQRTPHSAHTARST